MSGGFYDDTGILRVVSGFVVQFGLNGDPRVNAAWESARIQDDPVTQTNTPGRITSEGNAYLKQQFPRLDFIRKATVLP